MKRLKFAAGTEVNTICGPLSKLCEACGKANRFDVIKIDNDEYLEMFHSDEESPFGWIRINGSSAMYAAWAALNAIMNGGSDENYVSRHTMVTEYGPDWCSRAEKL